MHTVSNRHTLDWIHITSLNEWTKKNYGMVIVMMMISEHEERHSSDNDDEIIG
jgi:hypothetical protein